MIRKTVLSGALEIGINVNEAVVSKLELYSQELLKWNRKINLTAITNEKEVAVKHFIDALFFAEQISDNDYVLDIGSGAGVPAIPLKIAKPAVKIVSVDAVAKKIQFQKHVVRLLDLDEFKAIHARIENMHVEYAKQFDVITSRAFSSLEQFVKLSAPLLKLSGRLIAMKGPASPEEILNSENTLKELGFQIVKVINYDLPFNNGKRCLIVITYCNHV